MGSEAVDALPAMYDPLGSAGDGATFEYVPVIAIRRQRVSDEERYHEDPAIVDMGISFLDTNGIPVVPNEDDMDDDDEEEEDSNNSGILTKTNRSASYCLSRHNNDTNMSSHSSFAFHHDSSSFFRQIL